MTIFFAGFDLVRFDYDTKAFIYNEPKLYSTLFAVIIGGGYLYAMFRLARSFKFGQ